MNHEGKEKSKKERETENIVSVICQKVTGCKNKFRIKGQWEFGAFHEWTLIVNKIFCEWNFVVIRGYYRNTKWFDIRIWIWAQEGSWQLYVVKECSYTFGSVVRSVGRVRCLKKLWKLEAFWNFPRMRSIFGYW